MKTEAKKGAKKSRAGLLRDAFILHAAIMGLALLFRVFKLVNARFREAVLPVEAVYQFRAGQSCRRLILAHGKITSRNGAVPVPDFEVRFVDLPGAIRYMAKYPNDMLTLIMENKIEQAGNLYYLYELGYLFGLLEAITSRKAAPADQA